MPKTSLAEQLKRLQTPQTTLLIHKQDKQKASFLFHRKEAANFDRDTIYELALSGLEELKKLNQNFSAFDNTLFDITSKTFERSVESAEANEKLNDQIKTFLTLLCPYFLLKPAHKAIEWLIHRYYIHDFNVDEIMFLILPYHETMLFAQMLQLLRIDKETGRWYWLFPVKVEGVSLSKTALLNRVAKDMSFLKFISDMPAQAIKIHGSKASTLGTLFAFYCTAVIGGLQFADPISELHITHIMGSILVALSSTLPDYTAAAFMIISRLATKTCLSPKILTVLFNRISKVSHPSLHSETTLVLVLLSQNNEEKCEFPEKAVEKLAESSWFISSLKAIGKCGIIIRPFVCLLLSSSLKFAQRGDDSFKTFVQNLLTNINYDSHCAELIFNLLLEEYEEERGEENTKWFSDIIKQLEHSFPKVFDTIVSAALEDEESKAGIAVKTILGINTSRNDLFLKLVHPNQDVRVQAIKHIGKHFQPDQLAWLSQSLVDRLKDDSPKVVRQVLRLPQELLASVRSDTLISNLLVAIAKFASSYEPVVIQALQVLLANTEEIHDPLVLVAFIPHALLVMYKSTFLENTPPQRLKLLTALKSNCENETSAVVALWKSIVEVKEEGIPPVEDIITALEGSNSLKNHSAFWFSSALLIASKIKDQPSQITADQVINFLINYLHFPKLEMVGKNEMLSVDNLQSCISESLKGKLPLEGALHCLNSLSASIPTHSTRKPWLDLNSKANAFTVSIYKLLHEGCESDKKSVRVAFAQARTTFFESHFPEAESQILFLLNILILEPSLGSKCLDLVITIMNEDSNLLPCLLKENSLVVPSLLVLLGSPVESLRTRALQVLSIINDPLSTGFYIPLVEQLVSHSMEIQLDHEQVLIVAYKQLSPSTEVRSLLRPSLVKSMDSILQHLLSIITAVGSPHYVKSNLLQILEFVRSKEIFMALIPVATQIMGISDVLAEAESSVLVHILKRLDDSIVDLMKDDKFWNFLKIALGDSKTMVLTPDSEKGLCPAALLLNQLNKDFFEKIPEPKAELQVKFLALILEKVADVENAQVVTANAAFFKRISIDSSILVSLFMPMLNVFVPYSPSNVLRARLRKSSGSSLPSLETLETMEWKRGVCLLELIQNKKKLANVNLVLPVLFSLLRKCLQFEQQAPVEYGKQLLLSSILHCCEKLCEMDTDGGSEVPIQLLEALQVDTVVECVRASQNPQTHHHALLALSYIAQLLPNQVLHNLMAIFTFIGSSILRQDDGYSFQIISKIIETVIPILIKSQKGVALEEAVAGVVRVFVAAILDVPEHRRIPLFSKLMLTLNEGEFLWIFICLIAEKHVLNSNQDNQEKTMVGKKVFKYGLELCAQFPPSVILNTSSKILLYINKLPHEKDHIAQGKTMAKCLKAIFNVEENSSKQFRHYKYSQLTFLSSLMSSNSFVQKIAECNDEESESLKDVFRSNVEQCLIYLKSVSVQMETSSQLPSAKYWKAVLNQCYDILDKINALLPSEVFISVMGELLRHELEGVRRKAMELVGWRLQQPMPLPEGQLRQLLDPLVSALDAIPTASSAGDLPAPLPSTQLVPDSHITQQAALFALKLVARHLSTKYLDDFKNVLRKVTEMLCGENAPTGPVLGSLVLCLGELVSVLKAHSLPHLPQYMPVLISILQNNTTNEGGGDLLVLSTVTAIQKIVETQAQFLSPYLADLLCVIGILSAKHETQISDMPADQLMKAPSLPSKLKAIRQKLSSEVGVRVLVPGVIEAHRSLLRDGPRGYRAVGPLMQVLSDSFTSASDLGPETVRLFLSALKFRGHHQVPKPSLSESQAVEDPVIAAFTKLVFKLSESSFRPLFKKLFDWATSQKASKERVITYYRLSHHIAKNLKSLFPLFIGIFIENAADLLVKNNLANENGIWFDNESGADQSILLVDNIIGTLLAAFTHDSQKSLTKEHFSLLIEPLVDQLENRLGGDIVANDRSCNLVIPCLTEMATSTADDSLWKRLNHQILLKTRHSLPEVRILGMKGTCALAAKLRDDFLPLLPETVPFLAELLEDDVEGVENECQKIVNEMEEILGESIQSYF